MLYLYLKSNILLSYVSTLRVSTLNACLRFCLCFSHIVLFGIMFISIFTEKKILHAFQFVWAFFICPIFQSQYYKINIVILRMTKCVLDSNLEHYINVDHTI